MIKEFYDLLLDTIGQENYVMIAGTSAPHNEMMFYRGQFLISPDGMNNIAKWIEGDEKETEDAEAPQS